MCGICGELRFDGVLPDKEAIGRMSASMARRGPDHAGTFADGPLAFGHRRLAIIDLSASADQPMVDRALQLALVFNGTIYNYRELRAELIAMGYVFFSSSDTEVILKAYDAWGELCVQRFYGMFAFAIWDMRRQRLFLARDRFGIKPLYLARDGDRLRFASSVQARWPGVASIRSSIRSPCITTSRCTRWCQRRARSSPACANCRRPARCRLG
jgi:asparagine synthase (glutamine-hydrolysing)